MKLIAAPDGRVAHVDVIDAATGGRVNVYASEQDFWSSQAPLSGFALTTEPLDYATLTAAAARELGSQWQVIDR